MTEQELSAHLCGLCESRSEEERERLAIFHAGQCWPCREERCPLFGRPISIRMFGKHEASHKDLPVTMAPVPVVVQSPAQASTTDEISPEKKAELEVKLEKALPELDKTLRELEEASRPNPDLAGEIVGGSSSMKSTPLTEEFLAGCAKEIEGLDFNASPFVREARAMSEIPSGARQQMVGVPDETIGGNPT